MEEDAAVRLEQMTGPMRRDPRGTGDRIEGAGRVYDAVGPVPPGWFDAGAFTAQVNRRLRKQ